MKLLLNLLLIAYLLCFSIARKQPLSQTKLIDITETDLLEDGQCYIMRSLNDGKYVNDILQFKKEKDQAASLCVRIIDKEKNIVELKRASPDNDKRKLRLWCKSYSKTCYFNFYSDTTTSSQYIYKKVENGYTFQNVKYKKYLTVSYRSSKYVLGVKKDKRTTFTLEKNIKKTKASTKIEDGKCYYIRDVRSDSLTFYQYYKMSSTRTPLLKSHSNPNKNSLICIKVIDEKNRKITFYASPSSSQDKKYILDYGSYATFGRNEKDIKNYPPQVFEYKKEKFNNSTGFVFYKPNSNKMAIFTRMIYFIDMKYRKGQKYIYSFEEPYSEPKIENEKCYFLKHIISGKYVSKTKKSSSFIDFQDKKEAAFSICIGVIDESKNEVFLHYKKSSIVFDVRGASYGDNINIILWKMKIRKNNNQRFIYEKVKVGEKTGYAFKNVKSKKYFGKIDNYLKQGTFKDDGKYANANAFEIEEA